MRIMMASCGKKTASAIVNLLPVRKKSHLCYNKREMYNFVSRLKNVQLLYSAQCVLCNVFIKYITKPL